MHQEMLRIPETKPKTKHLQFLLSISEIWITCCFNFVVEHIFTSTIFYQIPGPLSFASTNSSCNFVCYYTVHISSFGLSFFSMVTGFYAINRAARNGGRKRQSTRNVTWWTSGPWNVWTCWLSIGTTKKQTNWPGNEQKYCLWLKSCTTWDVWNPINNGKNYQPQLVSRISAINSITLLWQFLRCFFLDPNCLKIHLDTSWFEPNKKTAGWFFFGCPPWPQPVGPKDLPPKKKKSHVEFPVLTIHGTIVWLIHVWYIQGWLIFMDGWFTYMDGWFLWNFENFGDFPNPWNPWDDLVYLPIITDPWMVDFYGINVGKYTVRPMDAIYGFWFLGIGPSVGRSVDLIYPPWN